MLFNNLQRPITGIIMSPWPSEPLLMQSLAIALAVTWSILPFQLHYHVDADEGRILAQPGVIP